MSKSFVILRDIGNLIGAILVINLIYSFTNNKDNESKFVQLKSIYKLILIFILLNFSKVIAGIFIDEIQIVLLTLYSSDGVVQGIIQSMH